MSFMFMNALIFSLLIGIGLFSNPKSPKDFRWEKRILISFGEDGFEEDFLEGHLKEIQERKLLLVHLVGDNLHWTNSEESLDLPGFLELRKQIRSGSSWALIGLDGGIKNQGAGKVPMELLFRQIDTMPMRQSEIRRNNGKDGL